MPALSSKLRAARKAAGLTQGQVAVRLAAVRTPCEASTAWSSYPDTIDYAPAPVGVAFFATQDTFADLCFFTGYFRYH